MYGVAVWARAIHERTWRSRRFLFCTHFADIWLPRYRVQYPNAGLRLRPLCRAAGRRSPCDTCQRRREDSHR